MYRNFLKLRLRMLELDYSSRELAKAANIATSTLSRKMTGKQPFNATEIMAIARVLDISPAEYAAFFFESVPERKGA